MRGDKTRGRGAKTLCITERTTWNWQSKSVITARAFGGRVGRACLKCEFFKKKKENLVLNQRHAVMCYQTELPGEESPIAAVCTTTPVGRRHNRGKKEESCEEYKEREGME
eukprot:TRINITY_DN38674_c0_g1_i1.p1 TRINITY_DN38674_c0_g1~~TRINITY_DN38674_c0_g1_i1.p1  ORF type:complete len:111 (-),score=13.27 TRINITY_DN38674_c0_g1_i1:235-567(-)